MLCYKKGSLQATCYVFLFVVAAAHYVALEEGEKPVKQSMQVKAS